MGGPPQMGANPYAMPKWVWVLFVGLLCYSCSALRLMLQAIDKQLYTTQWFTHWLQSLTCCIYCCIVLKEIWRSCSVIAHFCLSDELLTYGRQVKVSLCVVSAPGMMPQQQQQPMPPPQHMQVPQPQPAMMPQQPPAYGGAQPWAAPYQNPYGQMTPAMPAPADAGMCCIYAWQPWNFRPVCHRSWLGCLLVSVYNWCLGENV